MRAIWKGSISFGLVNVPVKLYPATENKDIKFNYLHAKCQSPLIYQRRCPVCDMEVPMEEVVKGYEYEKGKYVVLKEEDLQGLMAETTRTVDIVDFVDLEEIDPIFYEKSYYLAPGDGGQKAFSLLRQAMEQTGKIAIARVVLRSKESLAAVRVYKEGLLMETMFYPEEIRSQQALGELNFEVKLHENEIKMAVSLISSLSTSFDPKKYDNHYRQELMDRIGAKIAGEEVAVPEKPEGGRVVDLVEALKASIALAEKKGKEAAPKENEIEAEKKPRKRKTS